MTTYLILLLFQVDKYIALTKWWTTTAKSHVLLLRQRRHVPCRVYFCVLQLKAGGDADGNFTVITTIPY